MELSFYKDVKSVRPTKSLSAFYFYCTFKHLSRSEGFFLSFEMVTMGKKMTEVTKKNVSPPGFVVVV